MWFYNNSELWEYFSWWYDKCDFTFDAAYCVGRLSGCFRCQLLSRCLNKHYTCFSLIVSNNMNVYCIDRTLPPVDLRAVCFVRAILSTRWWEDEQWRESEVMIDGEMGEMRWWWSNNFGEEFHIRISRMSWWQVNDLTWNRLYDSCCLKNQRLH
jgi:hypothetical protein